MFEWFKSICGMNFSLAWFRSSTYNSMSISLPIACAVSRVISISNCKFNRYFDPVFYSASERISASFVRSAFKNTLSTAIRIESEYLANIFREKEKVTFRLNVHHGGTTLLQDCVFNECKTRGVISPLDCGGALYIRSNFPSNEAVICRCGFRNCVASGVGGCIYFYGNKLSVNMSEFKSSNATTGAAVFSEVCDATGKNTITSSSLRGAHHTYNGVLYFKDGNARVYSLNSTHNTANTGRGSVLSLTSTVSSSMTFMLMSKMKTGNLVMCHSCKPSVYLDCAVMINIVSPSPKAAGALAFTLCVNVSVSHAVYIKADIKYICCKRSQITLSDCVSDNILDNSMFENVKGYKQAFTIVSSDYRDWTQGPSPDVRVCWAMGSNTIIETNTFTASRTFSPTETLRELVLHEKDDMLWRDFKEQVPSSRTKQMNIDAYLAHLTLIVGI